MVSEILSPSVKHGEEPDLGTEMPGIGGDGLQGLGRRAEQNVVHGASVLEGNCCDLIRNGENNMEILRIEKLRPSGLDPFRSRE